MILNFNSSCTLQPKLPRNFTSPSCSSLLVGTRPSPVSPLMRSPVSCVQVSLLHSRNLLHCLCPAAPSLERTLWLLKPSIRNRAGKSEVSSTHPKASSSVSSIKQPVADTHRDFTPLACPLIRAQKLEQEPPPHHPSPSFLPHPVPPHIRNPNEYTCSCTVLPSMLCALACRHFREGPKSCLLYYTLSLTVFYD